MPLPLHKLTERQQRAALEALRVVGYLDLIGLTALLLGLKGPAQLSLPWVLAVPLLAVCGSLFYYLAWDRVITEVSKVDGRRYLRPYLLGSWLMIAAVVLFALLHLIKWLR